MRIGARLALGFGMVLAITLVIGVVGLFNATHFPDRVTQQHAALVEESAAAAENIASQAERLVRAVARFRRDHADARAGTAGLAPVDEAAASHHTARDENPYPRLGGVVPGRTPMLGAAD